MSSTLSITRGDVRQITITVRNVDGTVLNLTAKRLIFTAKLDRDLAAYVFQKSSATGGIIITTPSTGIATMSIFEADTSSLNNGTVLQCVIRLDDNPGNPVTIYQGTLTINWGVL